MITVDVRDIKDRERRSHVGGAPGTRRYGFILCIGVVLYSGVLSIGPALAFGNVDDVRFRMIQDIRSVSQYGLLELTFESQYPYKKKFFDVDISVEFVSPGRIKKVVKGFYYGGDLWKVRFRPDEPGKWTYRYMIIDRVNSRAEGAGDFVCAISDAEGQIRRHGKNPYRWVFANGGPYFPVGLQDCITIKDGHLGNMWIDGDETRKNGHPIFPEEYFSTYGEAGFNLFRFSQKNCSYMLYDDLDHYRESESLATDELLSLARKHGFRVMFGFFGSHNNRSSDSRPVFILKRVVQKFLWSKPEVIDTSVSHEIIAKEKRFIDYCVARWGVYADFWELLNERQASDEWTTLMADSVRSVDPDHKPISTSWQKPDLPAIDINSPHWYESEDELQSDLHVQQKATQWKAARKPVIVGEHGNTGMNWDPLSALRMRIRSWTALFQEIGIVYWNTSWSKAGMHHGRPNPRAGANIYLGPEERGYIQVLQSFSSKLDADVRMTPVQVSPPGQVRAYGLLSPTVAAVYLHHFENHTQPVQYLKIKMDFLSHGGYKSGLTTEWISPADGKVIKRERLASTPSFFEAPPFVVDLALLISRQDAR